MKKIYPLLIVLYIFTLLVSPSQAASATFDAVILWATKVLPSLLPFFIGAELLEGSGAFSMGTRLLEKPCRTILKGPGECAGVLLLSYAAGFPTGARVIGGLYNEGIFTKSQAERLTIWGAVSSPGFILAGVGVSMMNSVKAGWIMLACHIAGAVINGALFSINARNEIGRRKKTAAAVSFSGALTQAVSRTAIAMIGIGTTIAFFSVINSVFFRGSGISACLLEVTGGCDYVARSAMNTVLKTALLCSVLSFGGLSVIVQSAQFLEGVISLGKYAAAKLSHAAISGALCFLLARLLL